VVAGSGDGAALAAALQAWLRAQPPGSELTVETGTQVLTVHAGDPRASIALTEAVTRAGRSEPPAGFPRLKEPRPGSPPPDGYDV